MIARVREWTSEWVETLRAMPLAGAIVFSFSVYMTFVYMPYDVFGKWLVQDVADAREVWAGYMLRGWAAKATEPLHWWIYGSFVYGFSRRRPWVWPVSALYTLHVAVASGVWTILYGTYGTLGNVLAVIVSALFAALALALWRSRWSDSAGPEAKRKAQHTP